MTDYAEQLQQRDPRFLKILSVNEAEGTGEYEMRCLTTGAVERLAFTFDGARVITPLFDHEFVERAAARYHPPDSYAEPLAKLRSARATDESRFEDEYKARRRRELGLPEAK